MTGVYSSSVWDDEDRALFGACWTRPPQPNWNRRPLPSAEAVGSHPFLLTLTAKGLESLTGGEVLENYELCTPTGSLILPSTRFECLSAAAAQL